MIRLPTDEELEQGQQILREVYNTNAPAPVTANVESLYDLGRTTAYKLPEPVRFAPTPHVQGQDLFALHQSIESLRKRCAAESRPPTPEEFAIYRDNVSDVVRIIERLARPATLRGKVKKFFRVWHPLRNASEGEIGELLGFLLTYGKRSRIRQMLTER